MTDAELEGAYQQLAVSLRGRASNVRATHEEVENDLGMLRLLLSQVRTFRVAAAELLDSSQGFTPFTMGEWAGWPEAKRKAYAKLKSLVE